jgi:hypothetical protein
VGGDSYFLLKEAGNRGFNFIIHSKIKEIYTRRMQFNIPEGFLLFHIVARKLSIDGIFHIQRRMEPWSAQVAEVRPL